GLGTLAGIGAGVEVHNPTSFTTLIIDNHLDATPNETVTLTATGITGLPGLLGAPLPITFNANDLHALILTGGTGAHTHTALFTRTNPGSLTINYAHFPPASFHPGATNGSPPMVTGLTFPSSIRAGQFATLGGRLVDPDAGDTLSLSVDWGDGSKATQLTPDR